MILKMLTEKVNEFVVNSDTGIFNKPLLGAARADDSIFQKFQQPDAIGAHFRLPEMWMESPKTVLSFFLPYTAEIKKSNIIDPKRPSKNWLYGRIEGHKFLLEVNQYLKKLVEEHGGAGIIPSLDERFLGVEDPRTIDGKQYSYTSNWSERHVAFACGLGTFGLSKGLITKAGIAGRFGSLITDIALVPTERQYFGVYEYCTNCGKCIDRCPVNAISFDEGKKHPVCGAFINYTKKKYQPRYGCGKCQTGVPCQDKIPALLP